MDYDINQERSIVINFNESFNIVAIWDCPKTYFSCLDTVYKCIPSFNLKRTVVGYWRLDNLTGSHLQSRVNSVCQLMMS